MGAQTYPQGPTGMIVPAAPKAAWSPSHEQSRLDSRATAKPAISEYVNPYVAPVSPVTRYAGGPSSEVDLTKLDSYWNMQDAAPAQEGGNVGYTGVPGTGKMAEYERNAAATGRSSGGTARPGGGSYRGGGSSGPAPQNVAPMEAMKAPTMPEYNAPGYNAPAEDPSVYKNLRREEMAPGMRELREGTREAMNTAQSLDNPNARAKFVQQSLKGYGQGLEKVAAGASRSARSEAGRKRADQLSNYRLEHAQKSDNYLKNYQNEVNTIAANFLSEQNAQMANFNASMDPNVNVGGQQGGAGTLSKTAQRALPTYGGNQPNMGYFGN